MNKWKSNKILKIVLVVISLVTVALTACSAAAVIVIQNLGFYSGTEEEVLKDLQKRHSMIYSVMVMGCQESPVMLEEIDKTNFRYGIIKAKSLEDIDISNPASYEYYNFEEMPKKDALENDEAMAYDFEVGENTRYSWDCSLFGFGNVYQEVTEEADYWTENTEAVPIMGYWYNVADGIFYYEAEDAFYRVDEVQLSVGVDGEMLAFVYDSGQQAYYNMNPDSCWVKDYYLTFDAFDDRECSWETWQNIVLDGRSFGHTGIRFIDSENLSEELGKPISTNYYSLGDSDGMLFVRSDEDTWEEEKNTAEYYWVVSQVRSSLQKTGIHDGILEGDLYEQSAFVVRQAYTWRYISIVILVVSSILWVVSTILVLVMAGHKGRMEIVEVQTDTGGFGQESTEAASERTGESAEAASEGSGSRTELPEDEKTTVRTESRWVDIIKPGFYQKIPWDVETCIIAFLGGMMTLLAVETGYYWPNIMRVAGALVCCFLCYILCYIWLVDFVVRIKVGKWWRGTVTYKLLSWIGRKLGKVWRKVKGIFGLLQENISLLWKGILILGGISLLEFCGILVTSYSPEAELSIWLLYRFATVVLILVGIVQANKLKEGAKKLADGDLQEKISTEKMFWEFKKHGENLNSIHDGISLAVEKRMQSEHFRTELITNVSHDIKTPLTSIINYVDLLQKEEMENEKAKEYLEVLSRQSARLKKLTEDLIEASKASTGSMPVQIEELELGVFLTQTVGEFEEKLTAAGLRVVMHKPEQEIFVKADGRHLWRVVENLVQNICKYAQPDTRVYIDLDDLEKEAVISFKNISRYELNISGDALMERFVRGDSSRHTDGSGLGLSIAGSLMELMHGKLEIVVDGDLFKVVLHFPK